MSTKSVVVGSISMMVLASMMGCGAPPDGDEPEDESSSSDVSSAFTPIDDVPSLPAPQVPMLEQWGTRPPIWDLRHYLEEVQKQPWLGNCYMYWLKLHEPSGRIMEVPVTVCK